MVTLLKKHRDAIPDYKPARDFRKLPLLKVERKGTVYIVDSVQMEMFTISVFAEALDREVDTIRDLERKGKIPPAMFRFTMANGKGSKRFYSAAQVENANRLFYIKYKGAKYQRDPEYHEKFYADLRQVFFQKHVVVTDQGELVCPRDK